MINDIELIIAALKRIAYQVDDIIIQECPLNKLGNLEDDLTMLINAMDIYREPIQGKLKEIKSLGIDCDSVGNFHI